MQFRVLVALALAICLVSCAEGRVFRPKTDLHNHSAPFFEYYRSQHVGMAEPVIQNFTQWLDHFNEQDQTTWTQRYVVNDAYWNGTGPIFYMINGEGPMDALSVVAYQYVAWAQEFGALVVSIEHRFYGGSQPMPDLSTESLAYLNAEQALADAANFIAWFKKQWKAENNMVITFGGSYAGMLSGWMRQKYPALIDASIASSGPVHAEVDFYQYLDVVSASLTTIGGSQCVSNIASAIQKFQTLAATSSGLEQLGKTFNACAPIAPEDISVLFESMAGLFMGTVQYNQEIPGYANITELCDAMTNPANDPVTNFIELWEEFYGDGQYGCNDFSYWDMINELKNDTISEGVAGRQWFYQTCVEFGYYQTTDSSNQPFGNLFNISTQIQQCYDVFGWDFQPNVNWTLTEFGDRTPDGSETLWVNGSIDPWHSLGVLVTPPGAPFNTLLINGTAHCADMMPPYSGSPASLVPAQAIIRGTLAKWISAYSA